MDPEIRGEVQAVVIHRGGRRFRRGPFVLTRWPALRRRVVIVVVQTRRVCLEVRQRRGIGRIHVGVLDAEACEEGGEPLRLRPMVRRIIKGIITVVIDGRKCLCLVDPRRDRTLEPPDGPSRQEIGLEFLADGRRIVPPLGLQGVTEFMRKMPVSGKSPWPCAVSRISIAIRLTPKTTVPKQFLSGGKSSSAPYRFGEQGDCAMMGNLA